MQGIQGVIIIFGTIIADNIKQLNYFRCQSQKGNLIPTVVYRTFAKYFQPPQKDHQHHYKQLGLCEPLLLVLQDQSFLVQMEVKTSQ